MTNGIQAQADVNIRLTRPIDNETAVSGYAVFFAGTVQNPINNTITIGVLTDECARWAARQEFEVESSGSWSGTVWLPGDIEDETSCASAYTGTAGEEWVEVQKGLPVLLPTDERANRLQITNPSPLEFKAGENALIAGTAVEAPEVQVTIKNNETQEVIVEGVAPVGQFGFWEIELLIPEDAPDFVGLNVVIQDNPPQDPPYSLTTGATITR